MDSPVFKLAEVVTRAAETEALRKVVFSKCTDRTVIRAVASLKRISGKTMLQTETFYRDGKARHVNVSLGDVRRAVEAMAEEYRQINVMTTAGDAELRTSKSGTVTVLNADKLLRLMAVPDAVDKTEIADHDHAKDYILSGSESFLIRLGVSDKNGRIYDKKRSKFRQINKFLEHIREVEAHLSSEGEMYILDLCCGKSYLSFAVYYYFTAIRGRSVHMIGVDLKGDVIEYCTDVAKDLGFDGLTFYCMDIHTYEPTRRPDLVISLHACDIATDIVLNKAAAFGADVILSTPCCHHELNRTVDCPPLAFLTRHSMLRQKFSDAATDALRLLRLESVGYEVAALELIDPEDTPKNILLRAIRQKGFDPESAEAKKAREAFECAKKFLVGDTNLHI